MPELKSAIPFINIYSDAISSEVAVKFRNSSRVVTSSVIIAAALVPILMYFTGESYWFVGFGALAALFVIVRHWDNIKRLLAGNELKVERIKKD